MPAGLALFEVSTALSYELFTLPAGELIHDPPYVLRPIISADQEGIGGLDHKQIVNPEQHHLPIG
jgi:hypothetical protein